MLSGLGITANYKGFYYLSSAVHMCALQPQRLTRVTKYVYPQVAKQYGTNGKAVERSIRTVSDIAWEQNRNSLEQLACRKLPYKPGNGQLLAILTQSLRSARHLSVHGLGKPVAFPGKDQDVGMVDEPVYEGGCKTVIPKDGVPLAELQIRGDNEALALVTV